MLFIARELREIMANLGYHTINEMVGHTDNLEVNEDANMDYSNILMTPYNIHYEPKDTYDFELEKTVDMKILLPKFEPYFNEKKPHAETISISSTDRTVGTILSSVVTKQFITLYKTIHILFIVTVVQDNLLVLLYKKESL